MCRRREIPRQQGSLSAGWRSSRHRPRPGTFPAATRLGLSMTHKIRIFEKTGVFMLAWDDDGEPGLAIGELVDPEDGEDIDHLEATRAAALVPGNVGTGNILYWETMRGARLALKAARAAVKAVQAGKPWPDWALQAKAQGWTPPKGWTP